MAQSDLNLALNPGFGWELRLVAVTAPIAPAAGAVNAPNIPAAE
jgi:hypothetical protein